MKFTLSRPLQPRNPLVAQARFRQAGSHRSGIAADRQRGQRELARELRGADTRKTADHAPPDPYSP